MSTVMLSAILTALLQTLTPNFLIFGLTSKSLLWSASNHHGRKIFLDASSSLSVASSVAPLPPSVAKAILHYAATSNDTTKSMFAFELSAISAALLQTPTLNFLIFGLIPESLFWSTLNHHGHTIFLDENKYRISKFEQSNPKIEAYDVQFTTKVSDYPNLLVLTKFQPKSDCRLVEKGFGDEGRERGGEGGSGRGRGEG